MATDSLPDKITPPALVMDEAGVEILELVKEYNSLPVGDNKRHEIYKKIEDLNFYLEFFE